MDKDIVVANAKATMLKVSSEAAYNFLATALPFIRLPFISTVAKTIITSVADAVLTNAELGIYILYIDKVTADQNGDFIKAVNTKEEAIKQGATDEELKKLEQDQIDAFKRLAKYGA